MFGWFSKPRNLVWTGDVLIDARTDEILVKVEFQPKEDAWQYFWWDDFWNCWREARMFKTREGAKKFVEEKFR